MGWLMAYWWQHDLPRVYILERHTLHRWTVPKDWSLDSVTGIYPLLNFSCWPTDAQFWLAQLPPLLSLSVCLSVLGWQARVWLIMCVRNGTPGTFSTIVCCTGSQCQTKTMDLKHHLTHPSIVLDWSQFLIVQVAWKWQPVTARRQEAGQLWQQLAAAAAAGEGGSWAAAIFHSQSM